MAEDLLATHARSDVKAIEADELRSYADALRRKLGRYMRKYKILRERLTEVEQEIGERWP